MNHTTATEAKNKFGAILEKAQLEPIQIKKSKRKAVVMLSQEEYDRLIAIENAYWGELAKEVEKNGTFLTPEKTMNFLKKLMVEKLENR